MTRLTRDSFFVLALQCLLPMLYAQNTDSIKITSLKEVKITGYAGQSVQAITPAQILSGKELQRLNALSVADAVRYFSGIQLKDYGGIGGLKTVNIRSMGTHHVGVFYDGIQIGNAQNGIVDLGRFSLDNMEAISLYNGQKSAMLQPAKHFASASAIYLTTRTPVFENNKKRNLKFSLQGGSFHTVKTSLLWEQQIKDSITASFNAEYMRSSGKYKFSSRMKEGYDTTEVRQNGDIYALRIEQGFFGKIRNGDWKVKAYYYNSERGYPGASVREEPGKFRHQDRQWDSNFFLQSSLRKTIIATYELLLNAKYAYDYLHYQSDPRLDVTTMYVDNRYKQQEWYFSTAHRMRIRKWWESSVSTDFQLNRLDADLYDFAYPARYTGLFAVANALHFSGFKLQATLLGTFVRETTQAGKAAGNIQKYTPSIVASWKPWSKEEFTLRAFYKDIFRMPTLNDLYYTFIGNVDLKPEYARQYNMGAAYALALNSKVAKRIGIQADVYYNEVTDKIIAMPTSNQFRWTMVNLGLVEIRGVDLSLINNWQAGNEWDLKSRINYTYQQAVDKTNPSSAYYGNQIPYIPVNSISLILGNTFKSWDLNYSFIYTGDRYNASANIPENYEKAWYTSDISVVKSFQHKECTIRFTAEINNLFNQQYEVVRSYPMPGTSFFLKVNVQY